MAACEQPKALMIYLNNRDLLEDLSDAERGRLVLALLDYQKYGALPDFSGDLRIVFKVLRRDVDQSVARWESECARRSAAGKKSAAVRAAKKFVENVSCNNDYPLSETMEEGPVKSEQPEAALNGAEQSSTVLNTVAQPQAALNAEKHSSTTSTHTNTNSHSQSNTQSHSQSHSKSHTQSPSYARPQSRTQKDPDFQDETPSPAGGRGRERDFDRFWVAYPRKVGKQAARKAFERVNQPVERLLSALERQRNDPQWQRENGRYIPHPVTWLNQGRWEDEASAPPFPDCSAYGMESI